MYRASVSNSLKSYGLRYTDCLIETPSLKESLSLFPSSVREGRDRRTKRALDLSFKKKDFREYGPNGGEVEGIFDREIENVMERIERRDEEVELLRKGW